MRRFFSENPPSPGQKAVLSKEETKHLVQVLRIESGAQIQVINGKGQCILALVQNEGPRFFLAFVADQSPKDPSLETLPLHLEIGLLKADAMEWVIEKCVELGVQAVTPLFCKNSVVRGNDKDLLKFVERWKRIAHQSLKQCGRLIELEINPPVSFDVHLARPLAEAEIRIWCDEKSNPRDHAILGVLSKSNSVPNAKNFRLTLGPEGGFHSDERKTLEKSALRANLGSFVLRAETASVYGASVINAFLTNTRKTGQD
jgi:16S rRNA (uracil1498-N3)-methyltransferase